MHAASRRQFLTLAGLLCCDAVLATPAGAPKVCHVVVALCDNIHQRIVPVPLRLGRGDDLVDNLYWGAAYGVKTWFRRAPHWQLMAQLKDPLPDVLERLVFRLRGANVWVVADAWRGSRIEQATQTFLQYASGMGGASLGIGDVTLPVGGGANLVAYVGHDGLMDFRLVSYPAKSDEARRDAVILACASREYFREPLARTGANPLLWTTNLMAPEAYTLDAAIRGWARGDNAQSVRMDAARADAKYQKISVTGASRLFATGW